MATKKRAKLVQVYTGNGKGKTTAALGLALRALGHGMKVYMIQFMKGDKNYGEIISAKKLKNFKIVQFGRKEFVSKKKPAKVDIEFARKALAHANQVIKKGRYDIVILDEINVALDFKLIKLEEVLNLIKTKPSETELILTGRSAPKKLIEIGDLVTEMKALKHPYQKGVLGRKGIEY